MSLISNHLFHLSNTTLTHFESFFSQFSSAQSQLSLFTVTLVVTGAQIKFEPPLGDIENAVVGVVEDLVNVFQGVPRIETMLFSSLKGETGLVVPSMGVGDERVDGGRWVRSVVGRNLVAVQKWLLGYEKFKGVLGSKSEKRVEEFLRERRELSEVEGVRFFGPQMPFLWFWVHPFRWFCCTDSNH